MKVFVTNWAFNSLPFNKGITLHYFDDCTVLHADYENKDIFAPNSGIKVMEFDSETELASYFHNKGYKYSFCTSCEQKELSSSYDKFLEEEKQGDEELLEIIKDYDASVKNNPQT